MPLTELSRNQLIQKRREADKSVSSASVSEPEIKQSKRNEKNIFAPEETEVAADEHS